MAKRRFKKSRSARKMTIPMAVAVPVGAIGIALGKKALAGDTAGMMRQVGVGESGLEFDKVISVWGPVLVGVIIHKGASYLGVNRALGAAGVPFIRI